MTTTYFPPTEEPLPTYVVPSDSGEWTVDSSYVVPNSETFPVQQGPTCTTEVFDTYSLGKKKQLAPYT